ncbi:group II truncated hemoglobin [Catelliglobosispora koreensis]|uniref:group II truncated hemoglobin n=1 Tax=Catelliglobosispora koreensis TaxID=129052 RepID=UPI00036C13B0|nr:group II truncated hemoglobin [Catelliglobosispora koreensis]
MTEPESLYDAIGGMPVLRKLASAFYTQVLQDPLLAPVFANFTAEHTDHVAVWLAEVFGGPAEFTAHVGGHQHLLHSHLGLGITEEHRQRWLELMAVAVEQELPENELLRQRVLEYFDWGTKIAVEVSALPVGTDLGEPGSSPRWGWSGLVP